MYERRLRATLADSKRSVLLLGPRQVGKSTLLHDLNPDRVINLASPAEFREYSKHPDRFEAELRAAPPQVRTILVDEVQRVPALLDVVQVLSDERASRFRFLLSGSSARKLRRGQANLLPGRVNVHYLHPLFIRELGRSYDLDRVLAHGSLPGVYAESDPRERSAILRSYTDTYLREEIQAEALVRDVGGYGRLLDLVAASSGLVLNLAALCRDAGIGYETARRYLQILEDTLVVFTVPAWAGSDRASLVAHGRTFMFDLGVRAALLRHPLDRVLDDERGRLVEHLVGMEIYRRTTDLWPEAKLFHYRTRHGAEVDFVVEVGRETWAIEVKAATSVEGRSFAGFDSLAERTKIHRRIVVFLGKRAQKRGPIEVLPLEDFVNSLPG